MTLKINYQRKKIMFRLKSHAAMFAAYHRFINHFQSNGAGGIVVVGKHIVGFFIGECRCGLHDESGRGQQCRQRRRLVQAGGH
jgi:hypothetical protein